MSLLRNGRGRIRCFYECDHWASTTDVLPTQWSVAARVSLCECCADNTYPHCEGS